MDRSSEDSHRLLVTGGSGFIGRSVIRSAKQSQFHVLNIDLREPQVLHTSAEYKSVDILDLDSVRGVMEEFQPTHIIHLAGETEFTLRTPEEFATVIHGSANIIQVASELPTPPKLVHVSTQYVLEPGIPFTDQRRLVPYTPYGIAKARSEELLWQSALADWVIVRPCIVYGPHFTPFADGLLKFIASGQYMYPASRNPVRKTWGYVDNVADQMVRLVQVASGHRERRVFYLGDAVDEYSVWIDAFSRALSGRAARRMPSSFLLALGAAGEIAGKVGVRFPYNMGRYKRTVTSSPYSIDDTLALTGPPVIAFRDAVQTTVSWLHEYWSR